MAVDESTGINEVELLLTNLAARLRHLSQIYVYVDNCCSLRNKLTDIMGANIIVKLDLFHAVQRITRTLSKKHPFFLQCICDLKLVFRQPCDLGQERKLPTPTCEVISKNLDTFLTKWETCTNGDCRLVSEKTKKEVVLLKKHISKGCLSGIPTGAGTTKNEAFHRVLNVHFGRVSRVGIPLALALLTILIYQHNCKIHEKITSKPSDVFPLLKRKTDTWQKKETFGIVAKDDTIEMDITMDEADLSDEVSQLATVPDLMILFQSAFNMAKVAEYMKTKSDNSPIFNYSLLPFMSSVSNVILQTHQPSTGKSSLDEQRLELEHKQRLNNTLSAWNFQLHPINGDGNCLFSAVAFALKANATSLNLYDPNFIMENKLEINDLKKLARVLRDLMVKEWKDNASYYQGFLTSTTSTVDIEADNFLQSGYQRASEASELSPCSCQLRFQIYVAVRQPLRACPGNHC